MTTQTTWEIGLDDFMKECSDLVGGKIVSIDSEYWGHLSLHMDNGITLRIGCDGGGHNSSPYLLMDIVRQNET